MSKATKVKEIQRKLWVNRGLKMKIKELRLLIKNKEKGEAKADGK